MKTAELPLNLIESHILPKLPAKSVGRCMCVGKQWKSFLSTPMFVRMHLCHVTINDYKLVLLDLNPPATFRTLDGSSTIPKPNRNRNPNPNPRVEVIIASLDGLVCLASRKVPPKLAFWNPLKGAYKKLSSNPTFRSSFGVAYDVVGFYIDSSNNYKLLYLVHGGVFGAFIYSHILDSWREIAFSVG
ncbi:putative F-box-like domain superfamily protein [Helianthus anomalus]